MVSARLQKSRTLPSLWRTFPFIFLQLERGCKWNRIDLFAHVVRMRFCLFVCLFTWSDCFNLDTSESRTRKVDCARVNSITNLKLGRMVPNMINKVVRFRRLIYLPNETEKYAENELFVQQAAWLKYDKKKKTPARLLFFYKSRRRDEQGHSGAYHVNHFNELSHFSIAGSYLLYSNFLIQSVIAIRI